MTPVHVAVGVLQNDKGDVLVSQRLAGTHLEGLWEFPGGKVEPEETIQTALARELLEELSIKVQSASPLIRIRHDYPTKSVLLDVWRVTEFEGTPIGAEGQPLQWVDPLNLHQLRMPEADLPIIHAIQLPQFLLITPSPDVMDDYYFSTLQNVCEQFGRRLMIQLRIKGWGTVSERASLVERVFAVSEPNRVAVMLNGEEQGLESFRFSGRHISSDALRQYEDRAFIAGWCSCSCHDESELERAAKVGVDFVLLSPVNETQSHPNVTPLGWEAFQSLADRINVPIYALGGLSMNDLSKAQSMGAQGIAGISMFWELSNPNLDCRY